MAFVSAALQIQQSAGDRSVLSPVVHPSLPRSRE